MSTYNICERLINIKKVLKDSLPEEWEAFKADMSSKMDIFLLANRIDGDQYSRLIEMMN